MHDTAEPFENTTVRAARRGASRVLTLGTLRVPERRLTRPKPLLLLAYLALEGPTDRHRLAGLFFPDAADARDALSTTLARLKGLVDRGSTDDPRVSATVSTDSQEFLEAACLNDATGALALYKGPFAQGFDTAVGPEVEEWVLATRELLASVARDLYLRAAGAAVDNADRHAAWRYAQSAVRLTETHTLDPAGTAALLHELEALQVPVPDGWWRSLAQDPVEWLGARGSGSAGTLDAASGEHVSRIVPVPRLRSRHETNRGSGAHHN